MAVDFEAWLDQPGAHRVLLLVVDLLDDEDAAATLYLGTEGYTSRGSDTPADTHFEGVIVGDPRFNRSVTTAMWGGRSTSGWGGFELLNNHGDLDAYLDYHWRDAEISVYLGAPDWAFDDFGLIGKAIGEQLKAKSEHRFEIEVLDVLAVLDKPLQGLVYDDKIDNERLEGQPIPIALGRPLYVEPNKVEPNNLLYEFHDNEAVDVVDVFDDGFLLTEGVDWNRIATPGRFEVTGPAVGKITAHVLGQRPDDPADFVVGSDVLGGDGAFTSWSSDNPVGWTVTESPPNSEVTQNPAGEARITRTSSGPNIRLSNADVLQPGRTYVTDVDTTQHGTTVLSVGTEALNQLAGLAGPGIVPAHFISDGTDFVIFENANWGSDISIDDLTVQQVTEPIEYLPQWIPHLAVTRGGLSGSDLDSTSIDELDASANYRLARYVRRPVTILRLLQETMDAFGGWIFVNRSGQLSVGRLEAPAGTPDFELTDTELVGPIQREFDKAQYLTSAIAGARNNTPLDESVIAGAVTDDDREDLKAEWLITRTSENTLAPAYAHAALACPAETLLQDESDLIAEIDRRTALYAQERYFYTVTAFLAPLQIEPGMVIQVTTDSLDLDAGKKLRVVGVRESVLRNHVQIVGWG